MYQGQDWEPVILRRPESAPIKRAPQPPRHVVEAGKLAGATDSDRLKLVSKEMAQAIMLARCAQKLTQVQLTQLANLPQGTVQDIESGKAIYNDSIVNKVAKILRISTKGITKTC